MFTFQKKLINSKYYNYNNIANIVYLTNKYSESQHDFILVIKTKQNFIHCVSHCRETKMINVTRYMLLSNIRFIKSVLHN